MHGGMTPSGIAAPQFKHGRRSKYLPTRLVENYSQALEDQELLSLRDEIALVDARLNDVLGRVDTGEAGKTWNEARNAYEALVDALIDHDANGQRKAMNDLNSLLGKGQSDYAAWGEVQGLLDQRRKLVDAENKRQIAMQQMVSSEKAMAFAQALLFAVKENITDRTTLSAIQMSFTKLLNAEAVT
jgi:hypothetical protein